MPQWAAQFAHFCATGRFRCLAVTWQNFHPDLPDAPTDELKFAVTLQRLAATIQQAGLRGAHSPTHEGCWLNGHSFFGQRGGAVVA